MRRLEIDSYRRLRHFAECFSEGVKRSSLHAVASDQEFAPNLFVPRLHVYIFQRLAFGECEKIRAPIMLPAAVGGHERLNRNPKVFEGMRPLSVRAGLWP